MGMKFFGSLQPLALLALRMILALIFVYHGYPKLVNPNAAMREAFLQHGLPAYAVGIAGTLECFGALLLCVGLFTRPAAILLMLEIALVLWKMQGGHGIMAVREYEFPLLLAGASFVVGTVGAGMVSVDHIIWGEAGKKRRSTKSSKD
jgi:putative oxidoreductase